MLTALQNYTLDVQYKGKLIWISDALSRAHQNTTESSQHDIGLICALETIDHSENLSIAVYRIAEFRLETVKIQSCKVCNKKWMVTLKETV